MENELVLQLTGLLGETIIGQQPLAGGDISKAYLLHLKKKKVFCKLNSRQNAFDMFKIEAAGLKFISLFKGIRTPEVLACSKLAKGACLLLEYIEPVQATTKHLQKLGRLLAELHLHPCEKFGWERDNYIGSLPQSNTRHTNWAKFYACERLQPQLKLALTKNLLSRDEVPDVHEIEKVIHKYAPEVSPVPLHGDLWQGNYLISRGGDPYLIDPAVYCGHHEVDIAMTALFGGFGTDFYSAYHEIIPRTEGYARRKELYQLYYLLVHLNLFGNSYYPAVIKTLNSYF
ncbi:MAG: fructosamine kinase family protein [Eudoraea sp.]|nr:fructosamine kinase family protein [Eudoraea sp.]